MEYIDSVLNPSSKDRIKMWKAKKLNNLLYSSLHIQPIKMVEESVDELTGCIELHILEQYVQYSDELISKGIEQYKKLLNVTRDDVLFEVIN